jgi:ribosomal protein L7/L12
MDEQAILHKISVETNVNIEFLKDLFHNEKIHNLILAGKNIDAILLIRNIGPKIGLWEAKKIVEAFTNEMK